MKTDEAYFRDWFQSAFGYGYGTGEQYVLPALKCFFELTNKPNDGYDFQVLEADLSPTVAWLLISRLCDDRVDLITYGSSPRFGWLTPRGRKVKCFFTSHSEDELYAICTAFAQDECTPESCYCEGADGKCKNPFWAQ